MSINTEVYEQILDSEGFVNDCWNKFDQTTKIEILQKAGVDLVEEWVKVVGDADGQTLNI